jgi:putative DNA primase/helicase
MNIKRAGYLRDTTGNRRFWPVRCGEKIDVDGFKAVIDKIWAEAVYRFKQCEQLHLSEELEAMAAIEVARREAVHPWTGIVLAGIETLEDEFITADMIWERVLFGNRAQYHETTHNAIVDIMRHAKGWKGKTSYRKDRKTVEHGYVKIKEGEVK